MNPKTQTFEERRKHLAAYDDDALRDYFWKLADRAVAPMVELAKTHTTPSIERSVLLRMGFSSIESKAIVDAVERAGLLSKGAGGVVYKVHRATSMSLREAGLSLLGDGIETAKRLYGAKS
jgi:D-ornithine 4,5-aminomutase subunit alpha